MASPFPGMDPYLEHPARWPGVHLGLIATIRVMLNAVLPDRYVADAGERLYLVEPGRSIYPDALVIERAAVRPPRSGAAVAAAASDPPWLIISEPEEMREPFIQVVLSDDPGEVVAVIEVLSPANKTAGHVGREKYRTKQRELLNSPVHLLEVDLLRQGEHTVGAPLTDLARHGTWDYMVCLHRGGRGWEHEVWPATLRRRLPRVSVPLSAGDSDVTLDLQTVLERCYDDNAYGRRLDYREEPVPPLNKDDTEWSDALLREAGLRR
jgi:hypothetical protein